MASVMSNDFDLERNLSSAPVSEEPRVSNDDIVAVGSREDDLNMKEETRVSTGDSMSVENSAVDETRVLSGPGQEGEGARISDVDPMNHVFGESGSVDGARVVSENDSVCGDGEIELGFQNEKTRDIDVRNELVTPEASVIQIGDDGVIGKDPLGSGSASNLDVADDDAMREKASVRNFEGVVDAANGDLRIEKLNKLRASVGNDVGANDLNNFVKVGSFKILGSCFEMGDMVWAKVKSHPWWPGHIYNEAFASSSVRRSRRDGHVLVAFFGDSSYGWFDLTELVPYEPHYDEKSQQTNSRNFMNALEDSVDEVNRRSALSLSCRCRNPNNFRPANVPGYMVVDMVDYEPGSIYSVSQIQKARESFQPLEMLSFIKHLAAAQCIAESKSLSFIKHKAICLAYRRSIFEEFDETYAQAFGQQPVHVSPSKRAAGKEPSRAPLSGPLVMAEGLGCWKSSNKVLKPKELSKKDRYLFKRRDEAGKIRTTKINKAHGNSSASSVYEDGTSELAAASYVFQKRDDTVSNVDLLGTPSRDPLTASTNAITTKEIPAAGLDLVSGSTVSVKKVPLGPTSVSQLLESTKPSVAMLAVGSNDCDQVPESRTVGVSSANGVYVGLNDDLMKRKKMVKHPAGEHSPQKPNIAGKKPKKLRKVDGERTPVHLGTPSSGFGGLVKPAGKPMQIGASSRECKDIELIGSAPQRVGSLASGTVEWNVIEVPQLLADLLGLALNPYHGVEKNRPVIVRQFFRKFRSLNFLKSTSASPPESESGEARVMRSAPAAEHTDRTPSVSGKKDSKISTRHDNSIKEGRKRVPSERQEEIAAKRAKKITDVRSLAAEKKMLKNPEMKNLDGKTKVGVVQQPPPSRLTKTEQHMKRADRPPRVEEPTYLMMKFQSGSSLPSQFELKARFARFGPLDTSLSRVSYKTSTCRVAFLFKQDAHVAYRYAVGSKSLFANVKFMLRPVAAPEPQQLGSNRTEDSPMEPFAPRDSSMAEPMLPVSAQPVQQLKSCLKKSSGSDEPPGTPSNNLATSKITRVRFNMDEDKGGSGQMVMTDFSLSSSVAMDTVIDNQRFISSSLPLPPILPTPPPPFIRPPINHPRQHHAEMLPRDNLNYNVTPLPPVQAQPPLTPPQAPDITQQMMSLLTRCNDVVSNVKSILGYVPYHPL